MGNPAARQAGEIAWAPRGPRRRRRSLRGVPIVLIALAALAAGVYVGARHRPPEEQVAQRFLSAWERGDYPAMYGLVSERARHAATLAQFTRAYGDAAATATVAGIDAGRPHADGGSAYVSAVRVRTRIFGTIVARARIPVSGQGDGARVDWSPELTFPGRARGEGLTRTTRLAPRAAILARNGVALATGEARSSPLGPVAAEIAGRLGPAPPERSQELRAAGFPRTAQVGVSGLERAFDARLAGTPGGTLRAGSRVLAATEPQPGRTVRTTIDPTVERAAVAALAGRFGAVAVVRPRDGEVLALAGVAFSAVQPPGSTFKMITATAALQAGLVKPTDAFPIETHAVLEGVELQNANGEACGGTFAQAFAQSCNSVFAPLGARVGARRLVAAAERFGFNEPPTIIGAAPSTIPGPSEIGDDLAVGSSAIGQGKVQATALQMALVAAAIGERGRRVRPTLLGGERTRVARATSPRVARTVERLMLGVVRFGTGTAAAISGVRVAGKTGTAELKDTTRPAPAPGEPQPPPPPPDPTDTDAWFAAYAPAGDGHPRVAVCVLLVRAGAGGQTAAPAARGVLEAALRRTAR